MTSTDWSQHHSLANEALVAWYAEHGFGGRLGFGERPAVLVIDATAAWVDPQHPLGSDQTASLEAMRAVLDAARAVEAPIYYTTMKFRADMLDAGETYVAKAPGVEFLSVERDDLDPHPLLAPRPQEVVINKPRQSAFFQTNLLALLTERRVDTTIVVGYSTSGCVRSTCESALDYGYRVVVPAEAVGDRCRSAHEAALFDIDQRFADVMPAADVIARLAGERAGAGAP
jgi:nicotinamidase-related amidase